MVPRFYVERVNGRRNVLVIDRSTGDEFASAPDHVTAEIIASMFNNRIRFNEPLHHLSKKDEAYAGH